LILAPGQLADLRAQIRRNRLAKRKNLASNAVTPSDCVLLLLSKSGDEVGGMDRQHLNKFVAAFLFFALGLCVGVFGHELVTGTFAEQMNVHRTEAMRVSSPDGKLDAVLLEDASGGALGGVFWSVYIVPKGSAASNDFGRWHQAQFNVLKAVFRCGRNVSEVLTC
jgi:hypothetical protein